MRASTKGFEGSPWITVIPQKHALGVVVGFDELQDEPEALIAEITDIPVFGGWARTIDTPLVVDHKALKGFLLPHLTQPIIGD